MWECVKCGERVEGDHDICWNCGTDREGTEDPTFLSADESGALYDPVEDTEFHEYSELQEEFGEQLPDLVECFVAENITEARFVADQLRIIGIPSVSDRHNFEYGFPIPGATQLWGNSPKVKIRPADLPAALKWLETYQARRRERRQKRD